MGRPKKRQRSEEEGAAASGSRQHEGLRDDAVVRTGQHEFSNEAEPASSNTAVPAFDMDAFNNTFITGNDSQHWPFPPLGGDSSIPRPEDIPSLISAPSASSDRPPSNGQMQPIPHTNPHLPPASNDIGLPSCACLSTMYLVLNDLSIQTANPTFPSALNPLRNAMQTAQTVMACGECPKRFLTGLHNVQILGTLLVSIASTFSRTLNSIHAETHHLTSTNQTRSLAITDLSPNPQPPTSHSQPPSSSFTLTFSPQQYASLALSALRTEIHGLPSSKNTNIPADFPPQLTLTSLLSQMEERQKGFHSHGCDGHGNPPAGFPQGFGSTEWRKRRGEEPLCLKMVRATRDMIEGFEWEIGT